MAVMMTEAEEGDLKREVDTVIARAGNDIPADQRESFAHYVHALYYDVSLNDVTSEPASQHGQRVTGFWQWGHIRAPQEAKVRIHNPATVNANWRQDATFIEIITDDMPFLVDSVSAELARLGLTASLLLHPVFSVIRDADGTLQKIQTLRGEGMVRESWMHVSVERQPEETLETIRALLLKILADVRIAVMDWRDMRQSVATAIAAMPQEMPPGVALDDVREAQRFAEWLDNDHFVFLGFRDYKMSADGTRLEVDASTARGILRDSDLIVLRGIRHFDELPGAVRAFIQQPEVVFVNKTQARSTVHRSSPYDIVGIRRFSPDGKLIGLRVFIGLFTSLAYSVAAQDVPWLRQKVEHVMAQSHLDPKGHSGKALTHILNTYPRDDLFQIGEDRLYAIARGILMLAERIRTALFVWHDPFNRFVSCLVYTPRDRFDTTLRKAFIRILEDGFAGTANSFVTTLSDSPLVLLQVVIDLSANSRRPDTATLEKRLIAIARGWDDELTDELVTLHGAARGLALRARYAEAFPAIYRAVVSPGRAADDVDSIEAVLGARPIALTLHAVPDHSHNVQVRLFHRETPLALSDIVPHLENLGLRIVSEVPYAITPKDGAMVWVSELLAESRDGAPIALDSVRPLFTEAFHKLWDGALEDDRFNVLVLLLGFNWREVSLLRAYAKYLQQARFAPSTTFIRNTLANHAGIADLMVRLFHAQFDPAQQEDAGTKIAMLLVEIEQALEKVTSLAEDEVLRRYLNLIRATLRTNYYQRDAEGQSKSYISFKLDSQNLIELPLPRPLVEIWVYSPRVEGVHLRGGRVARGGLRWSDRRDDFRTEVLGLMKAQMVKNAVIVPVGSKGGFYCKQLPPDRVAEQKEVVVCYQTFIRGLLDLTDNRVGADVVPPQDVVRRDGDDPYLVVAADKGTAKFSDTANALSLEYGFWLGDAFASGGSAGYDHKVMGITARGAWESVKRHFRERGVDIQTTPFTCVGVGDMAGDVFGNGLLRSPVTLLVGAFNHKHIFLDPNPDPAVSFAERKRLFDLAGSQWSDYDSGKISTGGGVYERSAKTIPLTPEVQARYGLKAEKISPNELIKALLRADVDLLYLGGIGTYLKSTDETHVEVNDRANDGVRVNAAELHAKVVGEGANLGVTARARIEFARKGGAINSDAIDNSGGVDTSDHEVNIKIALQPDMASGALTNEARNSFLASMTEEVAALVLKDNYLQPQAITLEQRQAPALLDAHARMIQTWEKAGRLDRVVEFLPTEEQIAQRAQVGEGLSRPELAIMLAYAKLALNDELVRSTLPDDAAVEVDLMGYFPKAMREPYAEAIKAHRLRREIIATVLSNDIVNRMGSAFVQSLSERSGHSHADVVRACLIVRQVFDLKAFWRGVELLDNKVTASLQLDLLAKSQTFMARTVSAVLQMATRPIDVARMAADLAPSLQALEGAFSQSLPEGMRAGLERSKEALMQQGVPADLAARAALLDTLASGPDILVVAKLAGQTPAQAATVYYAVGHRFLLDYLRQQAQTHKTTNHWQRQEALALAEDLYAGQQKLAVRVLTQAGGDLEQWSDANKENLARCDALLREIQNTPQFDLSMLAMVGRSLRNLAGPADMQK